MKQEKNCIKISVEQIINEAIEREKALREYYRKAIDDVGPDARRLISCLHAQNNERIQRLESLLDEIRELRELTGSIAD
ncbi:MAG TPA: hypothetical protein VFF29_04120 [Bacteroidota bacterium]|nr:hypothetical protein [Bacteroidota bacterium]